MEVQEETVHKGLLRPNNHKQVKHTYKLESREGNAAIHKK